MPNRNGITNNQYPITNNQLDAKTNCYSIRHLSFVICHLSFRAKRGGFTLIELLIVIGIIALLTSLGTYSYNNAQAKARDAKRKQDINNIKKALQLYYEDNDIYPNTIDISTMGTYISSIPQDPKGENYIYAFTPGTCPPTCYKITACLENPNDSSKDPTTNTACTATSASFTITNPT